MRKMLTAVMSMLLIVAAAQAAQQPVVVGNAPNDSSGDPLRSAFIKLNANDAELYGKFSAISVTAESLGASPSASAAANTTAINAALANGGTVTLNTPGTYTIACPTAVLTGDSTNTYHVGLIVPSNTRFVLGRGVTLKAATGITNPVLIQNSNVSGGNVNIEIDGGIWDTSPAGNTRSDGSGNGNGGSGTFATMVIWLQNVVNVSLRRVTLLQPLAWGIGISNCSYGIFEDTYFKYSGGVMGVNNQGGYQFEGANSHIVVRNTRGVTYDDEVAFVTQDYGFYAQAMGGPGVVTDVLIDGVIADETTGAWNLVRLLDSVTYRMTKVIVKNMIGKYYNRAMVIGGLDSQSQVSYLDDITVSDAVLQSATAAPTNATIHITNSVRKLTLRGIKRIVAATETSPKSLIKIQKYNTFDTPAIGTLVIDDAEVDDLGGTAGTSIFDLTGGTVSAVTINQAVYNGSLNAGVGTGNIVGISAGTTVSSLALSNSKAIKAQRLFFFDGNVTEAAVIGNSFSGQTATPTDGALRIRGTVPNVKLVANDIDMGTTGYSGGAINFNGSTGTTVIRAYANNFHNVGQPNVGRAASEAIRVVSADMAVPNAILTEAVGDIFLDSSNGNNPYRCSTAPSTFTAL